MRGFCAFDGDRIFALNDLATLHARTAIEEEDDLLVAFILVFPRDELAVARARFPVDLAGRIALPILAQLLEFHALAAPGALQKPNLFEASVEHQQRVVRNAGEVRVDPHAALPECRSEQPVAPLPKTPWGIQPDFEVAEPVGAACLRGGPIREAQCACAVKY